MHAEVLGRFKRRERWTQQKRLRMVGETFLPDNSVSRLAGVQDVPAWEVVSFMTNYHSISAM